MTEEFQESDLFWPEQSHRREGRRYRSVFQDENVDPAQMMINNSFLASAAQQNLGQFQKKKSRQRNSSHSLPIDIPSKSSFLHYSNFNESDDELEKDAEMVPPHLIVACRFATQFGNGRSLKGRELRRVRNTILRLTGFLET